MGDTYLIVGLGNPGSKYDQTRHNIGFEIVDHFATSRRLTFKPTSRMKGDFAMGRVGQNKVFLLKPSTYMNLSGEAVRAVVSYYKIPLQNVLIVTDDVHLPFGVIRLKPRGSSGGHNGLENIENHLNTNHYPRMRIGVGYPADSDMADFVLEKFSSSELKSLEEVISRGVKAIEHWLARGLASAMNQFNVHPKKQEKNDEKEPL